jgi:hypothetical protein
MELHGSTPQKYAQNVLDKLFTREELINTVLVEDNSIVISNRTRCDSERLQIIKSMGIQISNHLKII